MRLIINSGPVQSNIKLYLFDNDIQKDVIPIKDNGELIDKIVPLMSQYDITKISFVSSPVWANNMIRILKSKEIEQGILDNIEYEIIYSERRTQE